MELKKSYSLELESIRSGQEEDQWRVWISRWIGDGLLVEVLEIDFPIPIS